MDFFENKRDSAICCGIVAFVALGLILILILPPSQERTIILTNGNNGNETPIGCHGATGLILAQNLTDLCDVSIISPLTGQIIRFNGSEWVNVASATFTNETTVCSGQAGNYNLVLLSSGGNCDFKNLLAGSSISMSDNGTHITITNTAPESTSCTNVGGFSQVYKDGNCNFRTLKGSPDISVVQGTNDITIDYNGTLASESTVCSGQTGNYNIVASSSGGNCTFKNLVAGTGESLSSNSTHITITNTSPESTSASNVGNGANVFKNQTSAILYFKTLLVGTGISVSNSTNTITFTNTGVISNSCVKGITCSGTNPSTFNTNFVNGTGIIITGTSAQTVTNIGVISNSCSGGITCAGTNPSTFTVSWELLCSTTLGSNQSSVTCSSFTARRFLHVELIQTNSATGTSGVFGFQFNSDTGNNYAVRFSSNGGADTTNGSIDSCRPQGSNTVGTNGKVLTTLDISNRINTDNKFGIGQLVSGANGAQSTIPAKTDYACQWSNTSAQITTISYTRISGTVNLAIGSQLVIWGHD